MLAVSAAASRLDFASDAPAPLCTSAVPASPDEVPLASPSSWMLAAIAPAAVAVAAVSAASVAAAVLSALAAVAALLALAVFPAPRVPFGAGPALPAAAASAVAASTSASALVAGSAWPTVTAAAPPLVASSAGGLPVCVLSGLAPVDFAALVCPPLAGADLATPGGDGAGRDDGDDGDGGDAATRRRAATATAHGGDGTLADPARPVSMSAKLLSVELGTAAPARAVVAVPAVLAAGAVALTVHSGAERVRRVRAAGGDLRPCAHRNEPVR